MRRDTLVVGVSLGILASIALMPPGAIAGRLGGAGPMGGHVFVGGHSFVSRPFARPPFFPRPFSGHRRFRSFPFVAISPPIGLYAPWPPFGGYSPLYGPPYYGPIYYNPSAAYGSPAPYTAPAVDTVSIVPPSPPMPDVVEYSKGRYELRGDGIATPYTWVWIPNPPPPPSPAAQPAVSGAGATQAERGPGRLYRWTDEQGVVHLTNLWQAVPRQYRSQAKHSQPS
jgi:hypothetical protein